MSIAVASGLIPLIYALSVGPTARLAMALAKPSGGLTGSGWWAKLYRPLIWVAEKTGMTGILEAYITLWLR